MKNTSDTERSQANSKPQEKACHHERHMTGIVHKVYNLVWRMQKKSGGSVSLTNQRIAKLIHAGSAQHVSRAKTVLARAGLFKYLGKSRNSVTGNWNGGRYQAVAHNEWAEMKAKELGHSPCRPDPLQVKVSNVHPGGKAFQSMRRKAVGHSGYTGEGHTAHVAGRTHGACPSKDIQSVDFNPSVDVSSAVPPSRGVGAQPPTIEKGVVSYDAVRRPVDAELRSASQQCENYGRGFAPPKPTPPDRKGFSPSDRKAKLEKRLADKLMKSGNTLERDFDDDEREAFAYLDYEPKDEPRNLPDGFVYVAWDEYDNRKDKLPPPGVLCCKIIDRCMSEQQKIRTLNCKYSDPSEYFYPPDFVAHRDRLRAEERKVEARKKERVA